MMKDTAAKEPKVSELITMEEAARLIASFKRHMARPRSETFVHRKPPPGTGAESERGEL